MTNGNNSIDMAITRGLIDLEKRGLQGFFRRQVTLFQAQAPEYLAAIERAANARNMSEVAKAAHKLNGFASTLGARNVRKICIALEQESSKGQPGEIGEFVAELRASVDDAIAALIQIADDQERTTS